MTRALLAVIALTFATPVVAQEKGRKVAFLVGVGEFRHDLTNLGTSPQKDATELGKVLKDGGFEVIVLTDKAATKAGIEGRFKALVNGNGSLAKGDLLLVALCTHGFSLPRIAGQPDQPFLAAHDSQLDKPNTMVSLNVLIADGKSSGATVLYLIDACRELPKDANRGFEPAQVTLPKGTAVLFGCGREQVSHQHKNADGHGLFTFAVLKTLRGERGLKDEVSWSGLVHEVEQAFKSKEFKAMIPAGKPQTPFATSGELTNTDIMRVPSALIVEADFRAFRTAQDQGDWKRKEFLRGVTTARKSAWREQANQGNPVAMALFGASADFGSDDAAAMMWYRNAADAGHPMGMVGVGLMYWSGRAVPKDDATAAKWLRKAADAGDLQGMNNLGFLHAEGKGVTKDDAAAVQWYRKAADGGHPQGMLNLAYMYLGGQGVTKSEAEAVKWFGKAADAGNARGMNDLGAMHEAGRGGLTKSTEAAIQWYKKAAALGDDMGQLNLKRLGKE